MTALGIIGLVYFSAVFVLLVFLSGVFIGASVVTNKQRKHAAPPAFVRRLPEQEPGYAESPATTFEQNIKNHGRAFAIIKGVKK